MAEKWDIFISYAARDEARSKELYQLLKPDCRVFFGKESLQPGDNWREKVTDALISSRVIVILVSMNSQRAWYQAEENARAIEIVRDSEGQTRMVPIYLDGPPKISDWNLFGLNVLHGLDATTCSIAEVAQRLLAITRGSPSEQSIHSAHVLHSIPSGPMVDGHFVDLALIEAYAESFSAARADLLVDQANAFRRQADKNASVIHKADVPRVELVEPIRYWQRVFGEARLHGPRMLAALLLVVNDQNFPSEAQAPRRQLLNLLQTGAASHQEVVNVD